jgi:hypothetical protein
VSVDQAHAAIRAQLRSDHETLVARKDWNFAELEYASGEHAQGNRFIDAGVRTSLAWGKPR